MPEFAIAPVPTLEVVRPGRQELLAPEPSMRDLSVPARDVMGRSPPWILRSGISALAGVLGLALFLSCLLRYPDTIQGRIVVTGNFPAVSLVAKQSGNLERLDVAEGDTVHAGQLMGIIKNTANSMQVLAVKREIERLQPFLADPTRFVRLNFDPDVQLGPVQSAYGDFVTCYRNYETLLSDSYAERTMAIVKEQLASKKVQLEAALKQNESSARESELAVEGMERMKRLYEKDAVSRAELQNQERTFIEQNRQASSLGKIVMEDQIALNDYQKQLNDLAHQRDESLRLGRQSLSEAWKKLMATVEVWEADYVLRSPVEGCVGFYDFWKEQQYVAAGKTVMIVVPAISTLVGRMPTKERGLGKIAPGQRVFIKLDDYPSREFGMVTGEVQSVSLVVQNGEQLVSIKIPNPLKTHLGKELPFKQEMTGEASIVTQDYRLIERAFQSLLSVVKPAKDIKPTAQPEVKNPCNVMCYQLNTSLALKIMVNSSVRSAQHEMAVHSKIDEAHPGRRYVIRLVEGFLLDKYPCLVFEPHGTELAKHLRKQAPLAPDDVRTVARQMLLALDALHAAGFAHGDVKPGNVLWDHESKVAKLIDLGWARGRYDRGQSIATQDYCPPEMLLGLEMTTAVDLWGLGCTLFEALTGQEMFDPYAACEAKYEEFDSNWTNPNAEEEKEEPEPEFPFKLEEGVLLGERYQLRSRMGSGKTGEVWLADAVQTNQRGGPSLKPEEIRSKAKPDDASNDRRPSKINVWDVVLGYEHFLQMQTHLGEYPAELARKGKYHYILFGEDGELRFKPKIEHVSIADRLMKVSGVDAATARSFEEIIKPMLALDSADRPTAAEMLQRIDR